MGAKELNTLAQDCLSRQDYDEARRYLELSLQRGKTKEAYRTLGVISAMNKDLQKATDLFDEALNIDEEDPETICALGDAYAFCNEPKQALGFFMLANKMAPDVLKYKERFLLVANFASLQEHNPAMEHIVLECLKTPELNCSEIAVLWYTILISKPVFQDILTSVGKDNIDVFNKDKFESLRDFSPFLTPYFLLGLKQMVVLQPAFEEFLACLRKILLNTIDSVSVMSNLSRDQRTMLAEAVASAAFFTDYIFEYTNAEKEKVQVLREHIEAAADLTAEREHVAVYAGYAPLYGLGNHLKILQAFGSDPLMREMVNSQINDWRRLKKRSAELKIITPIDDVVSGRVREQYEEFPYPIWKNLPVFHLIQENFIQRYAQKSALQVLVAGCGTGREAIWLARTLPLAEVLAIDLSRTSLAYAESKAKEFGVRNVTFRQADILQLGSIGKKFDLISCGGVLHHMEDPVRGWQVLIDILKPDGIMRIALYSKKARRNIVEAIKVIKEKKYSSTADGIRQFRRDASQILPKDVFLKLVRFNDYYYMSMCRDLLFHVQEHRFDIPELKRTFDRLGLDFVQMSEGTILEQYRKQYHNDPNGANLDQWDEFETAHPDTFRSMYQFWCQKKNG